VNTATRLIAATGALLAFLAVLLGALGSHMIDMRGLESIWDIAANMHLFNAAALIGLAALLAHSPSRLLLWACWIIIIGLVMFSGSIYLHVITAYKVTNLAPMGGTLLMAGWLLAVVAFVRKR
jgi:uncharacterized membrane protein YgdD (TMEM256/DUF423 family)